MKTFEEVYKESTCQKRVTVVEIYNKEGNLLSRESNRCEPEGKVCHRLGLVQNKKNYDVLSSCNWTHAEINAIKSLKPEDKPYKSILYGHNFYCDNCENKLKEKGIKIFEIKNI